jgi:hypothetical protein|tara:strand:+ start:538 stop:783 length:246 start_codon:yes stop_codon:yes gene_type:complete
MTLEGVKETKKDLLDGDVLNIETDRMEVFYGHIKKVESESEDNELLAMEKFKEVEVLSDQEFKNLDFKNVEGVQALNKQTI